jgi:hypothetical protein
MSVLTVQVLGSITGSAMGFFSSRELFHGMNGVDVRILCPCAVWGRALRITRSPAKSVRITM